MCILFFGVAVTRVGYQPAALTPSKPKIYIFTRTQYNYRSFRLDIFQYYCTSLSPDTNRSPDRFGPCAKTVASKRPTSCAAQPMAITRRIQREFSGAIITRKTVRARRAVKHFNIILLYYVVFVSVPPVPIKSRIHYIRGRRITITRVLVYWSCLPTIVDGKHCLQTVDIFNVCFTTGGKKKKKVERRTYDSTRRYITRDGVIKSTRLQLGDFFSHSKSHVCLIWVVWPYGTRKMPTARFRREHGLCTRGKQWDVQQMFIRCDILSSLTDFFLSYSISRV